MKSTPFFAGLSLTALLSSCSVYHSAPIDLNAEEASWKEASRVDSPTSITQNQARRIGLVMNPDLNKARLKLASGNEVAGVYKPCVIDGKYLYLSGHGPVRNDKSLIIGRIGKDLTMDEGKLAAQQVGLTMLATIQANLGSFNKIKRVIKVLGMVNCTPDFGKHPYVINGCSELFAAVWGPDNGVGTRSAVGFGSLPDNIPVEIEALFELYE